MVDFKLIRKRKTKKIVAISGSAALGACIVIGAIALLGQKASPLTVELNNSGANLTLCETSESLDKKSFLLAEGAPSYTEFNGNALPSYELTTEFDSELSKSILSPDKKSTLVYKYTFYVRNNGNKPADYKLSLNLSYPNRAADTFDLADILRVRFYENSELTSHDYKTYAKARQVWDEESSSYVPEKEHITDLESPLVDENFVSNKVILESDVKGFLPESVIRYTFVFWLEGNDLDSEGKVAPVGSSLILGVSIGAHEAEEQSSEEVTSQEE